MRCLRAVLILMGFEEVVVPQQLVGYAVQEMLAYHTSTFRSVE